MYTGQGRGWGHISDGSLPTFHPPERLPTMFLPVWALLVRHHEHGSGGVGTGCPLHKGWEGGLWGKKRLGGRSVVPAHFEMHGNSLGMGLKQTTGQIHVRRCRQPGHML